jgi:DNA helicase-2/ATP-dependent DNA helicase PcrA
VAQARLQNLADSQGVPLREALLLAADADLLAPAARTACRNLDRLFRSWEERMASGASVAEQLEHVLEESGMLDALRAERTIEAEGRLENLQELVGVAREYDRNNPDGSLRDFLEEISLYSDVDTMRGETAQVTLMTLHNAKGLEFPMVFVVGMEEGVFPHSRALDEQNLDEERRLCYVGITRAMDRLFLSFARSRMLYGAGQYNLPSRFLDELPSSLVQHRRSQGLTTTLLGRSRGWSDGATSPRAGLEGRKAPMAGRTQASSGVPSQEREQGGFSVGDRVKHAKFGEGVVMGVEPGGVVRVFFSELGEQKNLLIDYAPMKRV